jgi:hypothetical protein
MRFLKKSRTSEESVEKFFRALKIFLAQKSPLTLLCQREGLKRYLGEGR